MQFRKSFLFIIMCTALFLAACGEDNKNAKAESETEIDLSSYPNGVQLKKVSLNYFTILDETTTEYFEINENLKTINNYDIEGQKELFRKYLLYINGLNYTLSNDAEKEIDSYLSSFLYNTKQWAEYRIKNLDTNSDLDNSVANNYYTDAKNDLMMVLEVMNKYQLFHE